MVRKGPAVKDTVDEAIDRCAVVYNLRDSIEEARALAEQATDERQRKIHTQKGSFHLFQIFLDLIFSRSTESTAVL